MNCNENGNGTEETIEKRNERRGFTEERIPLVVALNTGTGLFSLE